MTDELTGLQMFQRALAQGPDQVAAQFFDYTLTYSELDRLSDSIAGYWHSNGIVEGDRIVLQLQNVPQFSISTVAAWKIGAAVVPLNPMYLAEEVEKCLIDSGAAAIVFAASRWTTAIGPATARHPSLVLLSTDEFELQSVNDPRVLVTTESTAPTPDLLEIARAGHPAPAVAPPRPGSLAALCYTSGTSGLPKAAIVSHANLFAAADGYRNWVGLEEGARIFALAPLCHISGFISSCTLPLLVGGSSVLIYRFNPELSLEQIRLTRPHLMSGPSTVYTALLGAISASMDDFSSFTLLATGGAPLPTAILKRFQVRLGHYVYNGYGLTETTAACVCVPVGLEAPVDNEAGVVSVGTAFPGYSVVILGEDGRQRPDGEDGEIAVAGPGVVEGYWRRPEETATTFVDGYLRTGDIGRIVDDWIYVLDRKKEMISASGFKVSPREVEDVLYRHPAVRESGVFGMADDYRGETVVACVSLQAGAVFDEDDIIGFVRRHLATFKVPRQIYLVDDLPKNTNGKIMRRELAGLVASSVL